MNALPSMAAIAKEVGVAKSTVSLALRNDPRVSAALREQIQIVAKSKGYQTNALVARLMFELRSGSKHKYISTIAFLNTSPVRHYPKLNSIVVGMINGAAERAELLGYTIDHFWLRDPDLPVKRLARILHTRNIQGVVFYGIQQENDLQKYEAIWNHFPSVTIGIRLKHPALHFVSTDHYSTASQACQQLRLRGYRRIGIVVDRWLDYLLENRFVAGYHENLPADQKPIPVLYLDDPQDSVRVEGRQRFNSWVKKYRPDACICLNRFILDWVQMLNAKEKGEMGVVFLDLMEELRGKAAGMIQQSPWIGMTAIDVLIGQILRREAGIPAFQRGTMIEGQWCPGPTVREPVTVI